MASGSALGNLVLSKRSLTIVLMLFSLTGAKTGHESVERNLPVISPSIISFKTMSSLIDCKSLLGVSLKNDKNRSTGEISLDGRRPNLKARPGCSLSSQTKSLNEG